MCRSTEALQPRAHDSRLLGLRGEPMREAPNVTPVSAATRRLSPLRGSLCTPGL
jgi:hypothetical protein